MHQRSAELRRGRQTKAPPVRGAKLVHHWFGRPRFPALRGFFMRILRAVRNQQCGSALGWRACCVPERRQALLWQSKVLCRAVRRSMALNGDAVGRQPAAKPQAMFLEADPAPGRLERAF